VFIFKWATISLLLFLCGLKDGALVLGFIIALLDTIIEDRNN